jgi:hypothetical protein
MASREEGEQQEQYRRRQRRRSSGEQHARVVHVGECPTAAEAERLQIPKRWERRGAHQRVRDRVYLYVGRVRDLFYADDYVHVQLL